MTEQELYNEYRKSDCKSFTDFLINKIAELGKENEQLRNNGFTVSAMTEQQLKVALEKGEQLEKDFRICEKNADTYYDQLTKATELLNEFMRISKASDEDFEHDYSELIGETEQFIKEIEK